MTSVISNGGAIDPDGLKKIESLIPDEMTDVKRKEGCGRRTQRRLSLAPAAIAVATFTDVFQVLSLNPRPRYGWMNYLPGLISY